MSKKKSKKYETVELEKVADLLTMADDKEAFNINSFIESLIVDYKSCGFHEGKFLRFGMLFMDLKSVNSSILIYYGFPLFTYKIMQDSIIIGGVVHLLATLIFQKTIYISFNLKYEFKKKNGQKNEELLNRLESIFPNCNFKFSQLNICNITEEFNNTFRNGNVLEKINEIIFNGSNDNSFDFVNSFEDEEDTSAMVEDSISKDSSDTSDDYLVSDDIVNLEFFDEEGMVYENYFDNSIFENDFSSNEIESETSSLPDNYYQSPENTTDISTLSSPNEHNFDKPNYSPITNGLLNDSNEEMFNQSDDNNEICFGPTSVSQSQCLNYDSGNDMEKELDDDEVLENNYPNDESIIESREECIKSDVDASVTEKIIECYAVDSDDDDDNDDNIVSQDCTKKMDSSDNESEIFFEEEIDYEGAYYSGDEEFLELGSTKWGQFINSKKKVVYKNVTETFNLTPLQKERLDLFLVSYIKYLIKNSLRSGKSFDDTEKHVNSVFYKFYFYLKNKNKNDNKFLSQMLKGTITAKALSECDPSDFGKKQVFTANEIAFNLQMQENPALCSFPCKKCSVYHTEGNSCRGND